MSDRQTASTINDTQLDELYNRLEFTEAQLAKAREVHREACQVAQGEGDSHSLCSMCDALDTPAKDRP